MSDFATEVLERPSAAPDLMGGLHFLWLEVTNRCNLKCSHCYSGSGPCEPETHGLELVDWLNLLGEASDLGCRNIQFIGGEPLLYTGLPDLLREARRLNYKTIEVFTNATRLSDPILQLFRECGVMVATSFYSDDECTHDVITGVRGSQQRTLRALERALAVDLPIRIGVVTMPENEATAQRTLEFLKRRGFENIGIDHVRSIGRGEANAKVRDPMQELCGACWRGLLAINSAGDVSPCVFSHFCKIGHVSEGLGNILGKPELRTFRESVRRLEAAASMQAAPCGPNKCAPQGGCVPKNTCDPLLCGPTYTCPG